MDYFTQLTKSRTDFCALQVLLIRQTIYYCMQRSLDPIYKVPYYIKWVKTSWTDSTYHSLLQEEMLGTLRIWMLRTSGPPWSTAAPRRERSLSTILVSCLHAAFS